LGLSQLPPERYHNFILAVWDPCRLEVPDLLGAH
jgi:hypothetical protein